MIQRKRSLLKKAFDNLDSEPVVDIKSALNHHELQDLIDRFGIVNVDRQKDGSFNITFRAKNGVEKISDGDLDFIHDLMRDSLTILGWEIYYNAAFNSLIITLYKI